MKNEWMDGSLFSKDQFRMEKLQIYNWGTFSGLHEIPISRKGFLFVGRSGAGKSTLLDAISALLIPPKWLDFNAAARETERTGRDRNLVSYIRGAWAEQKDDASGEIATRYLRSGSTWSALSVLFRSESGRTVTLVQLFWLRGNSGGNADVRHLYLVMEREATLSDFGDFGENDFDVRRLKQKFSDAFIQDTFSPYSERFCRILGIESDMALRLLHKTQSAKNLGDLNTFLREFMLDRPETFDAAERLTSEFGELNEAHQVVLKARDQLNTLLPARRLHRERLDLLEKKKALDEQNRFLPLYREMLRAGLIRDRLRELSVKLETEKGEETRLCAELENARMLERELDTKHRELGGGRAEELESELKNLESRREDTLRHRFRAENACKILGFDFPDSPETFARISSSAREESEQRETSSRALRESIYALRDSRKSAEEEFKTVFMELRALRERPSNIPADLQVLRKKIAREIGASEESLPFIGELMEVKPEESDWKGAIERVLRSFAMSLLVDERYYSALSTYVNANHLGKRLVYFRHIQSGQPAQEHPVGLNSLVLKLNIGEGNARNWLLNEIRTRFDYDCADNLQAFRNARDHAVTREGLVKHGALRHEKDDRLRVDDPRGWVLGMNNCEKLSLYETNARQLQETLVRLDTELETLSRRETGLSQRAVECRTLTDLSWSDVNMEPVLERISLTKELLAKAREGNAELRSAAVSLADQRKKLSEYDLRLRDVRVELRSTEKEKELRTKELLTAEEKISGNSIEGTLQETLKQRYADETESFSLDTIGKIDLAVLERLKNEMGTIDSEIVKTGTALKECFSDFIRRWPMESGDLDAVVESTPDFLARLDRLESDGLPAYEERFFNLLQNQSTQNLAALNTHLGEARRSIIERMALVNESLSQVPFNQHSNTMTFLKIEVSDRNLPEVRDFRRELQEALSRAWSEDREAAEARFNIIREMVTRFSSQEPDKKRWRELVLDVRLHVEFIGRELDESGTEVEIYRSGAGKSGGQRQKLATTCLAAALRYQLGGMEHGVPMYAPVVMDEAFDKADSDFTAQVMKIFEHFGFQMIVATPLKSVMTLEPFIGGACFVDISERKKSGVLLIEYDEEKQKLELPETHAEEALDENP